MRILYCIAIFLYSSGVGIAALFKNRKAQQWIEGRKDWEEKTRKAMMGVEKKKIWIHCASLGEFEQGRPIIEKIKLKDPSLFIVLSFFSPSGYELRKNFPHADFVCYLPADTSENARKFIEIISPSYVIFIKYEFWLHYFEELRRNQIPLFLVSATFRKSQVFFKWYGSFYRKILHSVNHFFVQDSESLNLLNKARFENVSITGDTRFDRVAAIVNEKKQIAKIENFKHQNRILIAGSTWPEDEKLLMHVVTFLKSKDVKLIIAPHEVAEKRIKEIMEKFSSFFSSDEIVRYSSEKDNSKAKILIIDNIGILSYAYRYGTLAWIGGGFGKGIHNTLEAAAFGLPVIFGPNHKKFREAVDLIYSGGAYTVGNEKESNSIIEKLLSNEKSLHESSEACLKYISKNTGATEKVLNSLLKI